MVAAYPQSGADAGHFEKGLQGVLNPPNSLGPVVVSVEARGPLGDWTYTPNAFTGVGLLASGEGVLPLYNLAKAIAFNTADRTKVRLVIPVDRYEDQFMQMDYIHRLINIAPEPGMRMITCGPGSFNEEMRKLLSEAGYTASMRLELDASMLTMQEGTALPDIEPVTPPSVNLSDAGEQTSMASTGTPSASAADSGAQVNDEEPLEDTVFGKELPQAARNIDEMEVEAITKKDIHAMQAV
ncbi:hypothetical protein WJX73_000601 [Symbiochloris irregularis]|uniref:Uncharacterized protein n=1 Tax=Symbiochloris irregularis TaxID=706552 RepID=A0AAW1P6K9_9CHLO